MEERSWRRLTCTTRQTSEEEKPQKDPSSQPHPYFMLKYCGVTRSALPVRVYRRPPRKLLRIGGGGFPAYKWMYDRFAEGPEIIG